MRSLGAIVHTRPMAVVMFVYDAYQYRGDEKNILSGISFHEYGGFFSPDLCTTENFADECRSVILNGDVLIGVVSDVFTSGDVSGLAFARARTYKNDSGETIIEWQKGLDKLLSRLNISKETTIRIGQRTFSRTI